MLVATRGTLTRSLCGTHLDRHDAGNQLRLWFASMAYVLLCALRRAALVPRRASILKFNQTSPAWVCYWEPTSREKPATQKSALKPNNSTRHPNCLS
jgi:hypothetical protein